MVELWTHGPVVCLDCFHEWIAVYELGTHVHCPECGSGGTLVESEYS